MVFFDRRLLRPPGRHPGRAGRTAARGRSVPGRGRGAVPDFPCSAQLILRAHCSISIRMSLNLVNIACCSSFSFALPSSRTVKPNSHDSPTSNTPLQHGHECFPCFFHSKAQRMWNLCPHAMVSRHACIGVRHTGQSSSVLSDMACCVGACLASMFVLPASNFLKTDINKVPPSPFVSRSAVK